MRLAGWFIFLPVLMLACAPLAAADDPVPEIAVEDRLIDVYGLGGPEAVAVNDAAGRAYSANRFSGSISVIGTASKHLLGTIRTIGSPADIAVNAETNRVYVLHPGLPGFISLIDGQSDTVIGVREVPYYPWSISVGEANDRVYVTGAQLVELDGDGNQLRSLAVNGQSASVSPDGQSLFMTDAHGDTPYVYAIDSETLTVRWSEAPTGVSPKIIRANNEEVYVGFERMTRVLDARTGSVLREWSHEGRSVLVDEGLDRLLLYRSGSQPVYSLLELSTLATITTFHAGRPSLDQPAPALSMATNDVYIPGGLETNTVDLFDVASGAQVARVGKPLDPAPWNLVADSDLNRMFVIHKHFTATIIEGLSGEPREVGGLLSRPFGAALHDEEHTVFVVGDHGIFEIDPAMDEALRILDNVGNSSAHVGLDPLTDRLYVPDHPGLLVVDIDQAEVVQELDSGGSAHGATVDAVRRRLVVWTRFGGAAYTGYIAAYDADSFAEIWRMDDGAEHVALDPASGRLYATDYRGMRAIDGGTGDLLDEIPAPGTYAAVDPNTGCVYAVARSGELWLVDGTTGDLVTKVTGFRGPWAVAVLPDLNQVYVADFDGYQVFVLQGGCEAISPTPEPVGGTVELTSDIDSDGATPAQLPRSGGDPGADGVAAAPTVVVLAAAAFAGWRLVRRRA